MMMPATHELNDKQFRTISDLVYRHCGINLKDGKEALVKARLMKRLRAIGMDSVESYLQLIESKAGDHELDQMIDAMTTNKTSFFREIEHFKFLREMVLPQFKGKRMRFWSAACSSGEEPYSLAMLLREHLPEMDRKDVLILATDISRRMIEKGAKALYSEDSLKDLPLSYLQKYFVKARNTACAYKVSDPVRSMVRIARLNLMDSWPMKGPFHVIFCRNVMIYFDRATQQRLINRFWELIEPGGYLFVGHSEGLSAITHKFKYVRPATYRK
jgi:chemotaxis protein methyltransferase CheR